jgi:hypothetical protein
MRLHRGHTEDKEDTRRTQGRHTEDTRKTHRGHKEDTKRTQGRHTEDTKRTQGRHTEDTTRTQRGHKEVTWRSQRGHKQEKHDRTLDPYHFGSTEPSISTTLKGRNSGSLLLGSHRNAIRSVV